MSRSISFSIIGSDGNALEIRTDASHPIEIIIPRDENLPIPRMRLQNATSLSLLPHAQTFNLHFVNLSTLTSSFSIHLEMHPLNRNRSYLLIYTFDRPPQLNSTISDIDGWSLLCPSLLHTFFLNNQQTSGHRSIIFGIRQLNETDLLHECTNEWNHTQPLRSDQPFRFTDNYELRLYTSGCFYLDADHRWRSDGLVVKCCPLYSFNDSIEFGVGGPIDESFTNAMFFKSSDYVRQWSSRPPRVDQLELYLHQC